MPIQASAQHLAIHTADGCQLVILYGVRMPTVCFYNRSHAHSMLLQLLSCLHYAFTIACTFTISLYKHQHAYSMLLEPPVCLQQSSTTNSVPTVCFYNSMHAYNIILQLTAQLLYASTTACMAAVSFYSCFECLQYAFSTLGTLVYVSSIYTPNPLNVCFPFIIFPNVCTLKILFAIPFHAIKSTSKNISNYQKNKVLYVCTRQVLQSQPQT